MDNVGIQLAALFNFSTARPVQCSGTLTFPIDFNDIIIANLPLTFPDVIGAGSLGIGTVTLTAVVPGGMATANGGGLIAEDRSQITDSLFNAINQVGGGIFETDGSSILADGGPNSSGVSFTPTALSLASMPVPADPFYAKYGGAPNDSRFEAHDVTTNRGFDFRVDLNGLRAAARASAAEAMPGQSLALESAARKASKASLVSGQHPQFAGLDLRSRRGRKPGMKDGPVARSPRFNAWASGKYVDFDDDQLNADRSGHIWRVTSGMSYRVSERATLGAFGRIRRGEVESTALQSSLDSDFYGGGLFAALTSHGGARLLLSGLYETSDSDIIIQGVTGSFDTDQWTVEGQIDKRFQRDNAWIEPAIRMFYTEADRESYQDSAGNRIASSTLSLARLSVGPTVGTTITGRGRHIAEIRPFAKIAGVWDLKSEGDFSLSTGAVFATSDSGLTVGGGMEVEFVRGTVFKVAGDWFETNSELEAWSVKAGLGTSLAALGLASLSPAGLVSLDFATTAQTQSAKARVTIPLN